MLYDFINKLFYLQSWSLSIHAPRHHAELMPFAQMVSVRVYQNTEAILTLVANQNVY